MPPASGPRPAVKAYLVAYNFAQALTACTTHTCIHLHGCRPNDALCCAQATGWTLCLAATAAAAAKGAGVRQQFLAGAVFARACKPGLLLLLLLL